MIILAIDTSCDETAVAVTEGRRVISNALYSQILIHKKWGGVVPSLAKRAHEEKIDSVITEALRKARMGIKDVDCVAVTRGPGLAVALEVGLGRAKELALKHDKKLISVNHLEGHIYSCFVQNRMGNPRNPFEFPYLAVIVSGGHTQIVKFTNHLTYEVIGSTVDDAAGEALDKAAKLLGLGYPGGHVLETLALQVKNQDFYRFPRPMKSSKDANFSFSGLKTSFYYFLKRAEGNQESLDIPKLASSFQEAVFDSLIHKITYSIQETKISHLIVGGGVIANKHLRTKIKNLVGKYAGHVLFPPFSYLTGDNAAMIGVVASFKASRHQFTDPASLDRIPRLELTSQTS